MEHLTENKLFSEKQYGFIKSRSTVTQLLRVLDEWTFSLEQQSQIDVFYTDLEKKHLTKCPITCLLKIV